MTTEHPHRDETAATPRLDLRVRWVAASVGILAVLGIGTVGTVAAVVDQRARAAQRDRQAAIVAGAAIGDSLRRSISALSGVDALAADGEVSDAEFRAFATRVLAGGVALQFLAHNAVVRDADRAAVQRRTGHPITELDAQGRFVPAGRRSSYIVVTDVLPRNPLTQTTLGFDIASDPVRAAAARRAAQLGEAWLTEPLKLTPSGRPGFFLIQPIFAPGTGGPVAPAGYLSTGMLAEDLLDSARERIPPGSAVALNDAATGGAAGRAAGATVTINAGGRSWSVSADDPGGPDPALPAVVGVSTVLLAGLLALLAVREARSDRARAMLARRLESDAARTHRLADVARRLSAAEHLDDVVRIIEERLPEVVGADVADVGLVLDNEYLSMLGAGSRREFDPDISDRYRLVPLGTHLPTTEAARRGDLVLVEDLAAYQRDEPTLLPDVVASGPRSVAATPLLNSTGAVTGVLGLAWREPTRFDPGLASVVRTLADLCGQTLERARDADRRHAFIAALQRRLLPTPPRVEGLEIVARYQPAAAAVGMGGDWYQFLSLPDGSLLLVIGDVIGHGVEAIATMTQIQHVIAAAVHAGLPLDTIFDHVHSALDSGEAVHATAQLLHVDCDHDLVEYAAAGHPYALVRAPDGTTAALAEAQHPLLGLPVETTTLARVPFRPGAMLLAYTDGLIERRRRPITAGIERLRRELARLPADDLPHGLDRLIENSRRMGPGESGIDDDVAVVLIHRPPC